MGDIKVDADVVLLDIGWSSLDITLDTATK